MAFDSKEIKGLLTYLFAYTVWYAFEAWMSGLYNEHGLRNSNFQGILFLSFKAMIEWMCSENSGC